MRSLLSVTYMFWANPNCLLLLTHCVRTALSFALERAGSSIAARMAMIAITTKSSINVKPHDFGLLQRNGVFIGLILLRGFRRDNWFLSNLKYHVLTTCVNAA